LPLILVGYSIVGAIVGAILYSLIIKIFQKFKLLNRYLVILGFFCGLAGALTANELYLGARPLQISIWGGIVGLFSVLIFNFRNKSVKDSRWSGS
jgi:prolipoprotein diacylglyceryltransferase